MSIDSRRGDAGDQQVEQPAGLLGRTAGQHESDQAGHHVVGLHVGAKAAVVGAGPQQQVNGADNAVAFLNRIKSRAEDKGVTICMEVMNSRLEDPGLGRKDQICDHMAWGVEVISRVNSPRVKILYDIYHAQIMDGDICRTIQQNFQWIAHFHTGGVPGRHELDDTQELNYRFIATTIADLGYTGYIAHEFRPTPGRDPIQSLKQAIDIITV